MAEILSGEDDDPSWSERARRTIADLRNKYDISDPGAPRFQHEAGRITWWTFGGGAANNVLSRAIQEQLGEVVTNDNLRLIFHDEAAKSEAAIRKAAGELASSGAFELHNALKWVPDSSRKRISKFQPCLSQRLESIMLADALLDLEGARVIAEGV